MEHRERFCPTCQNDVGLTGKEHGGGVAGAIHGDDGDLAAVLDFQHLGHGAVAGGDVVGGGREDHVVVLGVLHEGGVIAEAGLIVADAEDLIVDDVVGQQFEIVDGVLTGVGLVIVAVEGGQVHEGEGVAVLVGGLQQLVPGEPGAAARDVLHDDGLAQLLAEGFSQIPAAQVGGTARAVAAQQGDGLGGEVAGGGRGGLRLGFGGFRLCFGGFRLGFGGGCGGLGAGDEGQQHHEGESERDEFLHDCFPFLFLFLKVSLQCLMKIYWIGGPS